MTSLIFLIALFVITGIAAPGFLTYDNIVTCFNTATMYTLLAVGIAFVIMIFTDRCFKRRDLGLTADSDLVHRPAGREASEDACCVSGDGRAIQSGWAASRFVFQRACRLIFHPRHQRGGFGGLIYIISGGRTIENFGGADFQLRQCDRVRARDALLCDCGGAGCDFRIWHDEDPKGQVFHHGRRQRGRRESGRHLRAGHEILAAYMLCGLFGPGR